MIFGPRFAAPQPPPILLRIAHHRLTTLHPNVTILGLLKPTAGFSTIRDVARLAGVSSATVSAVINGKDCVSPRMLKRVQEAMNALDYHPDHMARSLKTGRSKVVGMVIPDLTNPFFVELMCGVEETARKAGYSVIFSDSNEDPEQERANLAMLYSQRVGGVVLACSDSHAAYDRMTMRRFPIVFIDRLPMGGFSGKAVIVDNAGAAYEATRHLIGLGHSGIAIIAPRTDLSNGPDRIEGFRKAMQEAHLPIRDQYFQRGDYSLESGYRCGLELLRMPEPPTAIFSCNNKMTLGLVQALSEQGIACPEFVSIVSFDDFPWTDYFQPRLTAISQPSLEMGRQAVRMLINVIDSGDAPQTDTADSVRVLKAALKIRESTAPPRA
jgi:LacI family transcriptional regulator